jgi:hypothetical protein
LRARIAVSAEDLDGLTLVLVDSDESGSGRVDPLTKKEADSLAAVAVPSPEVSASKQEVTHPVVSPVPVPGLIFGADSSTPATGSASQSGKAERSEWEQVWESSIRDYFVEQRGSKPIKGLSVTFPEFPAVFNELQSDLIDPMTPAATCRALLGKVRTACRKKGAHENASSFPTGTETNLLEFVNVKLLWQGGDRTLRPGVAVTTLNKSNVTSVMHPDYATGSEEVVGDHVRVAKPSATVAALLGFIADDTKDKLTTYPAKKVHVLVDVIPSTLGARALAENPQEARKAIVSALKDGIPAAILSRLARADVVLADGVVVAVEQKDLA